MTTALFMFRCVQIGLSIRDLDLLTIGLVNEMFIESRNDEYSYPTLADQSAMDMFKKNVPNGGFYDIIKRIIVEGRCEYAEHNC